MSNSWSSKQVLRQKDRISLAKDLLALHMMLLNLDSNTMGIMKTSKSMILDTISKNTLTNLGNV